MPKADSIQTLWIPEKPNVAREVVAALKRVKGARVLNQASAPSDGIYHLSSGDSVTCCFSGHTLSMLPPSRYLTREQNGNVMGSLPLVPKEFLYEPKPETDKTGAIKKGKDGKPAPNKRFQKLKEWVLAAEKVVNACDIDREGQLIFDEILRFCGRDPYASDIQRAKIVSMTEDAMNHTIANLDQNGAPAWHQRGDSALTRQKMDWLLGMNASMAYQVVTGIRTMSAGRVQTPVLAIVVLRDLAIERFKPQVYYVPIVIMPDGTRMRWDRREGAESETGFDPNGRIIDVILAQNIVSRIQSGLAGRVSAAKIENKSVPPPLPFSMGSLQSTASREHGFTVSEVTKAAQSLYERYKAITYVGTDCRFLPEDMHPQAGDVLSGLAERFSKEVSGAHPELKSRAFSNKSMGDAEHHAIIPTGETARLSQATSIELAVFSTIARRYIAQFYPNHRYQVANVTALFDRDEFKASSKRIAEAGWKEIEGDPDEEGGEQNGKPSRPAPQEAGKDHA